LNQGWYATEDDGVHLGEMPGPRQRDAEHNDQRSPEMDRRARKQHATRRSVMTERIKIRIIHTSHAETGNTGRHSSVCFEELKGNSDLR
jgi:hypothetical protein